MAAQPRAGFLRSINLYCQETMVMEHPVLKISLGRLLTRPFPV
jgi:hypothetical protein